MKRLHRTIAPVLLAAGLLCVGAAQAATLSLVSGDFVTPANPSSGSTYNSMLFKDQDSGVAVTAFAGNLNGSTYTENSGAGGSATYPMLGWWSGNGIGVYSNKGDEHTIDNKGVLDYVHFRFDQDVLIESVTISCLSCDLNPGADAAYLLGGIPGTWTEIAGPTGSNLPSTYTFNLNLTQASKDFRFGASQITQVQDGWQTVAGNATNGATCKRFYRNRTCREYNKVQIPIYKSQYDDFKIKSITVGLLANANCPLGDNCEQPPGECTENCPPTPVPEPTTLSILGLGVLALANRVRRRKF